MKKRISIKKFSKFILFSVLALIAITGGIIIGCRLAVKSASAPQYYQGNLAEAQHFDYILVPGAGIAAAKPGTFLKDRLDTAITLYENGSAPKIMVSGGYDHIEQLYESTVMKIYLTGKGVAEEDIICDEYGIDTAETLRRAKAFAKSKKFIVCTQSLYFERTAYLADQFGMDIAIADSDIHIYTSDVGKSRLRETLAATKAVFEGIFSKDCTYDLTRYPFIMGGASNE